MSAMDDMLAWLTTTLDEIEMREQRRLTLSERAGGADWEVRLRDPLTQSVVGGVPHDPRAVLARVAAERAILRDHRDANGGCFRCVWVGWPCPTLRWLGYGHRFDAPGFLEEWAPHDLETTT